MALKPRANNLKDAMNNFNLAPLEPSELPDFFVERDHSPLADLEIILEDLGSQTKHILFAGQRGSGKSTELAKLETLLERQYYVVRFSLADYFDVADLDFVDLLVSIPIAIGERLKQDKFRLGGSVQKLLDSLWNFGLTTEMVSESGRTEGGNVEISLGSVLGTLLGLKAQLKTESNTRNQVRAGVRDKISNLFEGIRILVHEAQGLAQDRPLLVIIEGTDKTDLEQSRKLFYEHGSNLSSVPVSVIYTIPIAFITDRNFNQTRNFFDDTHVLRNFKLRKRNQENIPENHQRIAEILKRRIDEKLISSEAIDQLVSFSGGVPRNLLRLAHDACLNARTEKSPTIETRHVEQAIVEERYFFRPSKADKARLIEVQKSKTIDQTEEYWNLLHNLSILEYRNHETWYDVYPVVEELLNDTQEPGDKGSGQES